MLAYARPLRRVMVHIIRVRSMPIYEYRATTSRSCPQCESGLEALQKLSDPPLAACPDCGAPLKRVISAASLPTSDDTLSRENIERHGFTQYKKAGAGVYEKTAGNGPDKLNK
ncbi:FmdB family zinc ribbon protein [Elongatibacter sediminis]|uniref:Zinc ribbon domain-containing protein n=1 Tax=Elongatibacter sediminis TaxID=3119006 RepID=A0AAW9RFH1_9GAMM